jgi:hypothetical protein
MADATKYAVRDYLRSVKYEAMKVHRELDGTGRTIYQYDCPAETPDGGICMRTQYAYSGSTFTVTGMRESLATWSASWDIS